MTKGNIKLDTSVLSKKNIFFLFIAFFVVFIFYLIPNPDGLSVNGKMMIGILIMAGILWMTEPIPLAITGLLVMIIQPILGVMSTADVFSSFGNQAVFFLIGAFIIASAIQRHGLHRRIAFRFLSFFEQSPKLLTFGIMVSCAFLSFIMPEHGVAALFLPIVTSILIAMKVIPRESNFGKVCMLCVAYGCSIGSLGTLIGGARNPLTIGILSDIGINVGFFDWMIYSMPIVLISIPLVWLVLQLSFPVDADNILDAKNEIRNQLDIAGNMSREEFIVLIILIITVLLWVFSTSVPYLDLAIVAIIGSILLFFTGSVNWNDIEKRVPWGIIILYGGAITLSTGMQSTGAGSFIAHLVFNNISVHPYVVILVLIVLTVALTNFMSNIGAVAIILPIGLAVSMEITEISPLLSSMVIALSGGLAFVFVIATPGNAITYSSGYFSIRDLARAGIVSNIICILVIFCIAVFYWVGVLGL